MKILSCLIILISLQAFSQEEASTSEASSAKSTDVKTTDLKAKKKKKTEKPEQNGFSLTTFLRTVTDLADSRSPRVYTNMLGLSLGASYNKVGFSVETAYAFTAVNNKVVDDVDTSARFTDTAFSAGYRLTWLNQNDTSVGLSYTLPTSDASRFEGINGSLGAAIAHKGYTAIDMLTINQALSYEYVLNKYEYSPVSREVTVQMAIAYKISLGLALTKSFKISVGAAAQAAKLSDGTDDPQPNLNANVSASYAYKNFFISAATMTGNYFDDKLTDYWFQERYKQITSLTLGGAWSF